VTAWLTQADGSDCQLFCVMNTLVSMGRPILTPASPHWQLLVRLIGAETGAAISVEKAAERYGLTTSTIPLVEACDRVPSMISVHAAGFHAVLCLGLKQLGDEWCIGLVNYNFTRGPAEEWLPLGLVDLCLFRGALNGATIFHEGPLPEVTLRAAPVLAAHITRERDVMLPLRDRLRKAQKGIMLGPFYRDGHYLGSGKGHTFNKLLDVHRLVRARFPDAQASTLSGVTLWFVGDRVVAEAWPKWASRSFRWPFDLYRARIMQPGRFLRERSR